MAGIIEKYSGNRNELNYAIYMNLMNTGEIQVFREAGAWIN